MPNARKASPLVVLCALAAAAGPARAGTVTVDTTPRAPKVVFTAAAGESNDVTVTRQLDGSIDVRDDGAAITLGTGCRGVGPGEAICDAPARAIPFVRLGDGDDLARAKGIGGVLDGGPGDDTLTGSDFDDQLLGGAGADTLTGGDGDDLMAGDGEPVGAAGSTSTRSVGTDVIDGGDGRDAVSYRGRPAPVAVDLTRASAAGQALEGDRLSGVEDVAGGNGDDVLTGDAHANALDGAGGDDVLNGASGDDQLTGGTGANVLLGGLGDDELDARGARVDAGACGAGIDAVVGPIAASTVLGDDCERVITSHNVPTAALLDARPSARRGSTLRVDGACPESARACTFSFVLRTVTASGVRGPVVAQGRSTLLAGQAGQFRLVLTRTGRRLVAARRPLSVRFEARGPRAPLGWTARWTPAL